MLATLGTKLKVGRDCIKKGRLISSPIWDQQPLSSVDRKASCVGFHAFPVHEFAYHSTAEGCWQIAWDSG